MPLTHSNLRNPGLLLGSIFCCAIILLIGALFLNFHTTKEHVVERLNVIAELSADGIRDVLKRGQIEAVERELAKISERFNLDGIELYSDDGRILSAYGNGVEESKLPKTLMLGEHLSVGWPFSLRVQYSRIVFLNHRPLGLLMLYDDLHFYSMTVLSLFLLVVIIGLALIFQTGISINPWHFSIARRNKDTEGKGQLYDAVSLEEMVVQRTVDLQHQRDEALLLARAKDDLLASTSHEIRTALNGVIGVLALLQRSGIEGENKRLLAAASRSADSLLTIINDILDFAKIESGKLEFENIVFDLREVVEESIALYKDTAQCKKVSLHCYVPLNITTRIVGDPTRLRQVITNLLNNALKFTEEGEVSFRVTTQIVEQGAQLFCFTIEDTGIGIEPDKIDGLFDMFYQGGSDTARKYGGTGLGLNVCKKLVEMQNGEIAVSSKPGRGTIFRFSLSFQVADEEKISLPWENKAPKKIVLFDNCETCSTVINDYLPHCNVISRSVRDNENIITQLHSLFEENYVPEALLIDGKLVGKECSADIKEINALYGDSAPQLFILSGRTGITNELRKKGVSGVIHKPIRLLQLYDALYSTSHGSETMHDELPEKLQGRVLLVDDELVNRHVGEMILQKIGLEVELALSGSDAIKLTEENRYDLVLMDIQMPGFDGIHATQMIREREKRNGESPHTIIAMTAHALPTVEQRCFSVGMNGFLTKPVKPDVLAEYLRPYLAKSKEFDQGNSAEATRFETHDNSKSENKKLRIWDRDLALKYVGGDEDLLVDLSALFIQRKAVLLDAIQSSMQTKDGREISNAAHAFKGAVNHFAAEQCQYLAQTIENKAERGKFDGLGEMFDQLRAATDVLVEQLEQQ